MTGPTPRYQTATELWTARVAEGQDALAFRYPKEGAWIDLSWKQADVAAREIGAGLLSLGIEAGDRVCVLSQTRVEWILCDLGTLLAGGAAVPIYPSNTADQCAYIVRDAGARAIIVEDASQLEKILPLLSGDFRAIYIQGDVTLDRPDAKGRSKITLAEVMAAAPPGAASTILSLDDVRSAGRARLQAQPGTLDARLKSVGPSDMFTIIYTSGTTGAPKGVVLSHENLVAGLASACRALTLIDEDLQYIWVPLAHVLGRQMVWAPILVGAPTAFTEGLTKLKDNLNEVHPTFMAGVPRVYEKFYAAVKAGMAQGSAVKKAIAAWAVGVGQEHSRLIRDGKKPGGWLSARYGIADKLVFSKLRARLGLDRCRFLISGGAPLSAEIAEFFHGAGLLILEGYGLTETMSAAFVNRIEKYRFGTVGPALDVVECKIADDGEILMRGKTVFREYYRNPEATKEAIDEQGWFHSGDIGHIEEGGFLRITDRKKDLIVTANGKKVAPQMVENQLKARSPLVSQAMVYGDKRPYCVALITLSEDAVKKYGNGDPAVAAASKEATAALKADVDALNATLAPFEQIGRFAILPADFSEATGDLTPSLKVKRKVVIERNAARLEALYGKNAESAA